jgi:hypothetical protein
VRSAPTTGALRSGRALGHGVLEVAAARYVSHCDAQVIERARLAA